MFKTYAVEPEREELQDERLVEDSGKSNSMLDDMLDAIDAEEVKSLGLDPDSPTHLVVNRDQAEYFTRLWKRALHDKEEINKIADDYLAKKTAQVEAYREREIGKLDNVIEYCSQILRPYAEQQLADSKKKTLALVEGSLTFRKQQSSYAYDDEKIKKMLGNMADGSRFLKPQEPKVDHASLKKAGQEMNGKFYLDGKLVDGIVITQKPASFVVK